jgi:hypothetical protein
MPLAERLFAVTDDAIEQILLADNSDDEDDLPLDEEDAGFLGEDVDNVGEEIIIERPVPQPPVPNVDHPSSPQPSISSALEASNSVPQNGSRPSPVSSTSAATNDLPEAPRSKRRAKIGQNEDISFIWKPRKANFQMETTEYEYGTVNIDIDWSVEPNAYEVFEKTCGFDELVALIVQQSELYTKQKGIPFQTGAQEIRAFLGMNLVMGYHVLPSLRDYWSSDPDLQVPYIANVMPRKRF